MFYLITTGEVGYINGIWTYKNHRSLELFCTGTEMTTTANTEYFRNLSNEWHRLFTPQAKTER
jgi:hypothetical protein